MSINDSIRWRVEQGMLYPLVPKAPGTAARRSMFLSEPLWKMLSATHEDPDLEDRLGYLQADLEVFANGGSISPKYLFLLSPLRDCVWEIRSVQHEPSIRVLGLFADKDVFIATGHALREDLGGWQSRQWREVKRAARANWRSLLGTYEPMNSTKIDELVTGAINGKYFKGAG